MSAWLLMASLSWAAPVLSDCDATVPDPGYAWLACGDVCEIIPTASGYTVSCDMALAGTDHDPFALAVSSVTYGGDTAEFVVLGNATEASFGEPGWCCRVDDEDYEVDAVELFGTVEDDEMFFTCNVIGHYTGCTSAFNLGNPDPSPPAGDLVTGRMFAVSGPPLEVYEDRLFGSNTNSATYQDELYGSTNREWIYGFGGDDYLYGGGHHDNLEGGRGDDVLVGGEGDDLLQGMQDDDVLFGGPGDDRLAGGNNNDILYGDDVGGSGSDRFEGGHGVDRFCDDDDGTEDEFDGDTTTGNFVDHAWVTGSVVAGSAMDGATNTCSPAGIMAGCSALATFADVCPDR